MIKEWNLLRSIACLSIVFLHSTTNIGRSVGYDLVENYHVYRVMLTYATPTFIILSEIILSNKYKERMPDSFFSRRLKLIFSPFIAFAIIDALVTDYLSVETTNTYGNIYENLLGDFEGYFILIIFQFYILHYIIIKFKVSVEKLLPFSIIIMATHLQLLNSNVPFITEYRAYLKLPFTAWFGFFTVAFLIGKYYEIIAKFLKSNKWMTIILVLFSMYFVYVSFESGNIRTVSRRIDIFPLSISISLAVLAWGQVIPNFKIINLISNFSLGIYLLHWQVQRIIAPYVADYFNSTNTKIIVLFLISLLISITIIKIISLLPFGKYIVGNTKRKRKNNTIA